MSENERQTQSDPAFEIVEISKERGTVVVEIQKGILGAMSNQLKNTNNHRKGASIIRELGCELGRVGDVLYGTDKQDQKGTV